MAGLFSVENFARLGRVVVASSLAGVAVGEVSQMVSAQESEMPSSYCETPRVELARSYNDDEAGSCFIKRNEVVGERRVVLVEDAMMLAYLIFSLDSDGSRWVNLVVFDGVALHYAATGSEPVPGKSLEMEFRGLNVTVDGWDDGSYVTYHWYDKSKLMWEKPKPKKRTPRLRNA